MCNGHIAEQGDLVAHGLRDLILRSAHNDIRADSHSLQFPDAGLGGLGLEFFRAMQIGHECHMDHAACALRLLLHELADRLVDRLGFDISHCAAHFYDRNGGFLLPLRLHVKAALDLIGHMGNDLHRSSAVIAPALLVQHGPVYFAGSDIGIVVQTLIDESLVVTQVQIRLCPVVGHENFAVLNRVHCARIHIQVGIKFLHSHFISARL